MCLQQFIGAVDYCHSHKTAHRWVTLLDLYYCLLQPAEECTDHSVLRVTVGDVRDLKLDNTLLDKQNPPFLKICDFGFARSWAGDLYRTKSHLGCGHHLTHPLPLHTPSGLPVCCEPAMSISLSLSYGLPVSSHGQRQGLRLLWGRACTQDAGVHVARAAAQPEPGQEDAAGVRPAPRGRVGGWRAAAGGSVRRIPLGPHPPA